MTMTLWLFLAPLAFVAILAWTLDRLRKSRGWLGDEEANYVQAIQALKTDTPLTLPPVRPLKAQRQAPIRNVERFKRRCATGN